MEEFQSSIYELFFANKGYGAFLDISLSKRVDNIKGDDDISIAKALNAAFLISICGSQHPEYRSAMDFLQQTAESEQFSETAGFYLAGIDLVLNELQGVCKYDLNFLNRLKDLSEWMSQKKGTVNTDITLENVWSVFFPEANGINSDRKYSIDSLRLKRSVSIKEFNNTPIADPAHEILFTSNILLTVPPKSNKESRVFLSDGIKEELTSILDEKQLYWYDHPIPIGVDPEKNEVLYGLRGLDEAVAFEKKRGNMPRDGRVLCALSVSVTHHGLHRIAKDYLEEQLIESGGLKNIDVYVFSEEETGKLINEIIIPAAGHYLGIADPDIEETMAMFGVDGEYGRHYSFLKAIAALWNVLVMSEIKATFKIDLDQVFPQEVLVEQTGSSTFEHFMTPLWGAKGVDSQGRSLDFGMIAGALVNESDISKSLFYPDVDFPDQEPSPDEYVFYSTLPQALSTEAEMMTRYTEGDLDGYDRCIKRVHVTGGTNGILINSLRKYRPFTPSFMGRAEDQAYLLSVILKKDPGLAYVHKDGLIMRHDKDAFAQEAIKSAQVSKLIGDYIRILYFSAYAKHLSPDLSEIKAEVDPFTGCFISKIPKTVVYLRFCLKAESLIKSGKGMDAIEFIKNGAVRIKDGIRFISGKRSMLSRQFEREKKGWNIFYDVVDAIENGLKGNDEFAMELKTRAENVVSECLIHF